MMDCSCSFERVASVINRDGRKLARDNENPNET